LLWQWNVNGPVYAQPLAVANVQTTYSGCQPCNLIFISTENDWLYAFNANSNSQTPIWSHDLAGSTATGNTAINCNNLPPNVAFGPCSAPSLASGPVGVTGTPVIDTTGGANNNTLYVVAAAQGGSVVAYYLLAVNITTGKLAAQAFQIAGTVNGYAPPAGKYCGSTYPQQGQVSFVANYAVQRSALLLLPNGAVYVAFAPYPEDYNGWMFGYALSSGQLSQTATFNSTPYGTGGGIWGSGAGPAASADGKSIYVTRGNGTTYDVVNGVPLDMADSLLRLDPSSFAILDYYIQGDLLTYPPPNGYGLCKNDKDFASGGVLLIPSPFTYNNQSIVINADKQSNLYVANQAALGGYSGPSTTVCPSSPNNIQCITTPTFNGKLLDPGQGYWASPAFWEYLIGSTPTYMLYYSATTTTNPQAAPYPLNGYTLSTGGTSGPIPLTQPPPLSTATGFCYYSPTPSVSSNSTKAGTGIVWAIENPNTQNKGTPPSCSGTTYLPAVLHAFNATTLQEIYNSSSLTGAQIGYAKGFPTPTIFQGQVYMGTSTGPSNNLPGVDVFGLCSTMQSGKCMQ
jgi:hypothetical protein